MGGGHLNIGGRLHTELYHPQNSGSALTNSFIRANAVPPSPYGAQYSPFTNQDDSFPPLGSRQQSIDIMIPTIDTTHPGSNYGSPRDEDLNRFGLGLSPVAQKGLSVLDAPLPASFDSNGVSWIARNGPIASSVPAKFGLESPPGSLGAAKDGRTSEALKSLHSSAFGDDTRDRFNGIAASPPAPPAEEYFGKRVMHSQRFAKSKVMSASLPKQVDQDWEAAFTFEEDYLPETLKDLMTPQEKLAAALAMQTKKAAPSTAALEHPTTTRPLNLARRPTPAHRDGDLCSNGTSSKRKKRSEQQHRELQLSDTLARHSATHHYIQVLAPNRAPLLDRATPAISHPTSRLLPVNPQ